MPASRLVMLLRSAQKRLLPLSKVESFCPIKSSLLYFACHAFATVARARHNVVVVLGVCPVWHCGE